MKDNIYSSAENKFQQMKNHIKSLASDPIFGKIPHSGISNKDWNPDVYICGFLDVIDIIDKYIPELDIYDKNKTK